MGRVKMTVSLPEEIAVYLRSTSSISSTIAEAVTEYRTRELDRVLEAAYQEDAAAAELLNHKWEAVNVEPEE
jgi:hypothetical protein